MRGFDTVSQNIFRPDGWLRGAGPKPPKPAPPAPDLNTYTGNPVSRSVPEIDDQGVTIPPAEREARIAALNGLDNAKTTHSNFGYDSQPHAQASERSRQLVNGVLDMPRRAGSVSTGELNKYVEPMLGPAMQTPIMPTVPGAARSAMTGDAISRVLRTHGK